MATRRTAQTDALPNRVGRPKASNSLATRQTLLEVALREFAEGGYATTTLKGIARRAGLTTGSVYHYFESKNDLFNAVAESAADRVMDVLREHVPADAPFADQLTAAFAVNGLVREQSLDIGRFLLHLDTEARRHPELAPVAKRIRERRDSFYRALVHSAIERGEIAEGIDPGGMVDALSVLRDAMARLTVRARTPRRQKAALEALEAIIDGRALARGTAVAVPASPHENNAASVPLS